MKKKVLFILLFISIILLTFFIDYKCPFREYLHILCPGCGGRDMVVHLLHFEIYEAFISNQLLFLLLPTIFLLLIIKYIFKKNIKIHNWYYILLIIVIILFTILRNIL